MLMFLIVAASLAWMHFAILTMQRRQVPQLAGPQYLPEADVLGPVLPPRPDKATAEQAKRRAAASDDERRVPA
jgi:hypothetical protein